MDSLVCSICGAEELVPKYTPPFTCPVCGRVNSVYVNGRLAHGHEAPGSIPPQADAHMVTTGIKMPRYLLHRVQVAADERCLGRNLLIRMLIEQGLDRLIPIEQLTKEKEADNERAANQGGSDDSGSSRFDRYQRGLRAASTDTSEGQPNPSSSTTGVSGGGDGPDPECPGVRMDVSGATYGPPGEMPAQAESVRSHDADRRVDLDRAEHGGGSFDVVQ